MNGHQKFAITLGLIALGCTAFAMPYRVVGANGIPTAAAEAAAVTLWRPLHKAPKPQSFERVIGLQFNSLWVRQAALDAGKLALVWGAIVICTSAWTALASGPARPKKATTPTPSILK